MSNGGNVKDLRISALIKEIDQLKLAIRELQDNVRKLSANDEHTVRVFQLVQEKHNGLKDVVMKTLIKVTHLENDLHKILNENASYPAVQPKAEVKALAVAPDKPTEPSSPAPSSRPRDAFKKPPTDET